MKTSTLVKSLALAAASMATTAALAQGVFTFTEAGLGDTLGAPQVVVADALNGNYSERLALTGTATSGTFTSVAFFNVGNFAINFGTPAAHNVISNNGGVGGYNLYGLFVSSGTYSVSGGVNTFTNDPTKPNSIQLVADLNQNTTFGFNSTPSLVLGNTADDKVLATSIKQVGGAGNITPGGTGTPNGNFEFLFSNLGLTPTGDATFTSPNPFYLFVDLNGNFRDFPLPVGGSSTLSDTGGSANVFFETVPEPASLALLGIGMLGLTTPWKKRKA